MKKFNLLRASSLILSSYFIIGFSSCSNSLKRNNSRYIETNINDIIYEKLEIDDYLKYSSELKNVFDNFENEYENIYIFNIPRTYQEYQLYVYDGKDYINIGYILKNGRDLIFEYFVTETEYVKNIKYFYEFNYQKKLKKTKFEITYTDLEINCSYKEYSNLDKSIIYNQANNVLEIILKSDNKLEFRYDLVNNIELDILEEEYKILEKSLIIAYKEHDLESFFENNESILMTILSRGEDNAIYYEYNLILEYIKNLKNESRIRFK